MMIGKLWMPEGPEVVLSHRAKIPESNDSSLDIYRGNWLGGVPTDSCRVIWE